MTLQLLCCQRAFAAIDQFDGVTVGQKQHKHASIDNVGGSRHQLHTRAPRQSTADGGSSPALLVHVLFNSVAPIAVAAGNLTDSRAVPRTSYNAPIWLVHRALLL